MIMTVSSEDYCNSLTSYSRFKTREVIVGKIGIGGNNPIRIQSMTTTDTMDTKKTVDQSILLVKTKAKSQTRLIIVVSNSNLHI